MARRIRDPLVLLLILAGLAFGLAPLILPKAFSDLTGFQGTDVFLIRLAGAATLGYGVGLIVGFRGPWRAIWIAIAGVCVFNLGSIVACLLALAAGGAQPVVYVVLVTSIVFVVLSAYLLLDPPLRPGESAVASDQPDIASWVVWLFIVGTAAAAVFGLGPLILGGGFGRLFGYTGHDDWIYRQAGAATLGAAVGGLLALRSRRWAEIRVPAVMALTFNATSVLAAIVEIAGGGAQLVVYLILATAGLVTAGTALALVRNGR